MVLDRQEDKRRKEKRKRSNNCDSADRLCKINLEVATYGTNSNRVCVPIPGNNPGRLRANCAWRVLNFVADHEKVNHSSSSYVQSQRFGHTNNEDPSSMNLFIDLFTKMQKSTFAHDIQ
ncbi:hypothetical protein AXFE_26150 [Acidithrix ferrooxidans]|uniref:Uncharacterized protein n=1 Tax=Acidithrix ferrooxidans TaxID=1280514 RepID=A0A0D8HFI8_9ACTN|nr:hypothetical protein AXFE_26150 [Acidithrix ferrooxidans]